MNAAVLLRRALNCLEKMDAWRNDSLMDTTGLRMEVEHIAQLFINQGHPKTRLAGICLKSQVLKWLDGESVGEREFAEEYGGEICQK